VHIIFNILSGGVMSDSIDKVAEKEERRRKLKIIGVGGGVTLAVMTFFTLLQMYRVSGEEYKAEPDPCAKKSPIYSMCPSTTNPIGVSALCTILISEEYVGNFVSNPDGSCVYTETMPDEEGYEKIFVFDDGKCDGKLTGAVTKIVSKQKDSSGKPKHTKFFYRSPKKFFDQDTMPIHLRKNQEYYQKRTKKMRICRPH